MSKKTEPEKKEEETMSIKSALIGVVVFLLIFFGIIIIGVVKCSGPSNSPPPKPKTREDVVHACFSAWSGSHINFARIVKEALNNPSSFEHVDTKYIDNGDTLNLIMTYRGSNTFGAIITSRIRAESNTLTCKVEKIVPLN